MIYFLLRMMILFEVKYFRTTSVFAECYPKIPTQIGSPSHKLVNHRGDKGRGEKGGVSLLSQLESTPQLGS
jgi:hypothetical protein